MGENKAFGVFSGFFLVFSRFFLLFSKVFLLFSKVFLWRQHVLFGCSRVCLKDGSLDSQSAIKKLCMRLPLHAENTKLQTCFLSVKKSKPSKNH